MRWLPAIALLMLASAAYAVGFRSQTPGVVPGLGGLGREQMLIPDQGGPPIPPPPCSDSLAFDEACNSQYIGAL